MTEIRALRIADFPEAWKLGQCYIDDRLRPDIKRARETYQLMLADRTNYMVGEFENGQMVGAIIVGQQANAYAAKAFGTVYAWFGSAALLDDAIEWWRGRPVMRCLSLQFPLEVSASVYRLLRMRGFSRDGDMNVLWRNK